MKRLLKKVTACLSVACLCIGLCGGCSDNDDYEVYAVLYGVVTDNETGEPIENATVTLSPSSYTQKTDLTGSYRFEKLDAQQYTIVVQKTGYQPNRKNITAVSGEEMEVNIPLTLIETENDDK